jgi:hypothetical protein
LKDALSQHLRAAAQGIMSSGSMWFTRDYDRAYAQHNFLETNVLLRALLNASDADSPLLVAGGERPDGSQIGGMIGPEGKGRFADSIMGLAKSHEFEYRAPTRELDH